MRTFTLSARRPAGGTDLLAGLNEEQQAVVSAPPGPMLVIAGAGSGKTRSLTCRLAWLLQQGVDPARVLLVTFTNRAAREMLHRAQDLVREDAMRIWAGTFHHVANRLLREHAPRLGLSPQFSILDRQDAADLLAAAAADSGTPAESTRFPSPSVLAAIASLVANRLEPLALVLAGRYPMFVRLESWIALVLQRYAEEKRQRQMLDYDDLLSSLRHLLEADPAARDDLADRFQHILVDEYQDTNAIQGRIVDLLAARHRSVCVVGDDSQSIYGFRGASPANMLGFRQRYPDAREYRLEINYRSTPEVLAVANASIECNVQRLPKRLRAVRPGGLKPAMVPCSDHMVQARFIAEYVLHLLDQGWGLDDIAVLYRSHWHALEIQLELKAHNIPFAVRGGIRFFEQAHIKDVLAFLRLLHNGQDELAWQRVLRLTPRVGDRLARRIWLEIGRSQDPRRELAAAGLRAQIPEAAGRAVSALSGLLEELEGAGGPAGMLERLMERFYDDYLSSHQDGPELRRADVRGVCDFARQYTTLEAFLSDVAITGEFSAETCVDGPQEQQFVTLSTVHQAKGLEWPVVLIPWMADGRFPTDLAMGTREDLEEERRVFHVAVTRARDELYLIAPQVWSTHQGQRVLMKPSRFLSEIEGRSLLETLHLEGDLPMVTSGG